MSRIRRFASAALPSISVSCIRWLECVSAFHRLASPLGFLSPFLALRRPDRSPPKICPVGRFVSVMAQRRPFSLTENIKTTALEKAPGQSLPMVLRYMPSSRMPSLSSIYIPMELFQAPRCFEWAIGASRLSTGPYRNRSWRLPRGSPRIRFRWSKAGLADALPRAMRLKCKRNVPTAPEVRYLGDLAAQGALAAKGWAFGIASPNSDQRTHLRTQVPYPLGIARSPKSRQHRV